ncbi:hypothetical protein Metme_2222 [Methylomonas methanica MC09]|uniref:Lnb N-terminal periplasmic domain-containing protein n=2 Tax=Methylomonas methanica TaxID=421 RepID=G0A7F6_METMM|nr:hypothetical protein Metme_2222 [Methylomonas methanica MC09]
MLLSEFLKNLFTGFQVLILIVFTAWGVFAVYYGDSRTSWGQVSVATAFGSLGLALLFGFIVSRWRIQWLLGYLMLFIGILIWWLGIVPSNDRIWRLDVARLPYATFNGDNVTLHNIRNFNYLSEFVYQPAYYTKSFDVTKLEGVDLFVFYWTGPAIAHTIMSFNFGEQGHLAVSIETRNQLNEEYSTIKGFFRQYELIYIVADERDVIRLRTNYRKNPPEQGFLYPLTGTKENGQRLLLEYLKKINQLREKPEFYNTLLDNCTVAIWIRSWATSENLPFSWKILLSGYLPEYLYESHLLEQRLPFTELQQRAFINPAARVADQAPDFSNKVRARY